MRFAGTANAFAHLIAPIYAVVSASTWTDATQAFAVSSMPILATAIALERFLRPIRKIAVNAE